MSDSEMRRYFAKQLRHYLNLSGYSQADMARHMKVSTATTAKWCTGATIPRVDKIQSLCNWLGIEKSDLLDPWKSEGNRALLELAKQMDPALRALQDKIGKLTIENRISVEIFVDALLAKQDKEKEEGSAG